MRLALVLSGLVALVPAAARAADPLPLLIAAPSPVAAPSTGAQAAAPLPSMALDPQVPDSIYHGLYVGTEIFGVGGHGIKGGIGGDVYAGYDRALGNGLLVGPAGHDRLRAVDPGAARPQGLRLRRGQRPGGYPWVGSRPS